jgi:hypothetical protein
MGLNTSLQQFLERLNDLNRYLLYFPGGNPKIFWNQILRGLKSSIKPNTYYLIYVERKIAIYERQIFKNISRERYFIPILSNMECKMTPII